MGVQIGERNTQIIYTYNRLTWTDGVAPPPLVSVSGVIDSPYRGLSAFEEQDAAFFFGREAAATQVLERMSRHLQGVGLLVVSGVSGAGKSSLLRAGVLPRIRGTGLPSAPESASWPCLLFTPTSSPLDELALRVASLAGVDAAAVRRGLEADSEGFALTADQAALARPPGSAGTLAGQAAERDALPQQRLLLVVDQFEQLFTQCADEGERRRFVTALHAAASIPLGSAHRPPALVVLAIRADFEARCADYPQLADAIQDRYLVTAMTGRQLRLAITEPAKRAGSQVDDDLVELLLDDMHARRPEISGAGVLPLLSHALDQAWRSRTGEALTVADYERTGGIEGAVADSAQRAYDCLTAGQQRAARQVFTRLTATSSDGADTADRVAKAELTEGKNRAEIQDVEAVLEAFAAERLLTLAADTVEISHEVLLTAWPLLRDTWLAETHADRSVRTQLRSAAAEWTRHSRDPSYLYGGSLLWAAAETAARIDADPLRNPPLSQAERDFLDASGRAHRHTARRRQAVIAGLLALTLTAIAAAGIAVHNAANTARQHAIALSRQLAAEGLSIDSAHPVAARRLAVAAWHVFPTGQARTLLTTLLTEQQQKGILPVAPSTVTAVAFSPSGKLLAAPSSDGYVRLWDPDTGQPARAPLKASSQGGVTAVAFSPDGKLLASAGGDGYVRLWDPDTGQPARAPLKASSQGGVTAVAFSPDGKLLASAGGDGYVRLWDPDTGQPARAPLKASSQGGVTAVAFSPDGKLLASAGGDGYVRLWDPDTGQPARAPLKASSQGGVTAVAFSPSGKLLASAGGNGDDGYVQVWNPVTGQPASAPIPASIEASITAVAFSPDGKLLAGADGDGNVYAWNPVTGLLAGLSLQIATRVTGVAFSPDGKLLAGAGGDGAVRLWDPVTGQPGSTGLQVAIGKVSVDEVAFSPDGKLLASAGGDGYVRLWDPVTGQPARAPLRAVTAAAAQGNVLVVAFSPDGKLLASAGGDGYVRLWNPVTGRPARAPLKATSLGGVAAVAFSPDGKLLASAGGDGYVRLWNPATGQPARAPLRVDTFYQGGAGAVAFSPDGKLLATAGGDGLIRLWNPVTGQPARAPLKASSQGRVTPVAFSPDGKLLASVANDDGLVRFWDPVTGKPARAPLRAVTGTVAQAGVLAVAFSPDGKLLAAPSGDGTMVGLWNPVTGRPAASLAFADGQDVGSALAFSPDGKLLASGGDGTVQFYDVPLFTDPYKTLCADVGPPTRQEWNTYAHGEPQPSVCG